MPDHRLLLSSQQHRKGCRGFRPGALRRGEIPGAGEPGGASGVCADRVWIRDRQRASLQTAP